MVLNIEIDEKAKSLIQDKSITAFLIDIDFMEESCVQVFSPIIKVKFSENDEFKQKTIIDGINIYFSQDYLEKFRDFKNLLISVKGLLRKHLFVQNINPIIKNICKIN